MFLRAGITIAVLTVSLSVAGVSGAANQTVMALPSDDFSPADVTVNVGEKVTWSNSGGNHNVVLDEGNTRLNAPSTSSWTVERTFTAVGTVRYYCEIHGDPNGVGMAGIVRVVDPSGGGPPPGGDPPPGGSPPPGDNPPGGGDPGPGLPLLMVSLNVSDATPLAGKRLRLFGVVRPARDGRKVQIQRRGRNGQFKAIATTRLKDAGAAKSEFSLLLRVAADAVLRARVAGDDERGTGLSKTRKVDVHKPRRR
ncbi:MAG: plastocyanin [Thermoleophilaceae bacterium]|jgi:plastocyanin|nr:plastocyanin [Thermoleophilaceae bacterium]